MKTAAVFFPFDLFGSAGTGEGVVMLADALQELLEDNRRETVATRADCYTHRVAMQEFAFEELAAYQDWRDQARKAAQSAFRKKQFLLWVTGNHLGVLPVYEELARLTKDTLVVQFDAHLDIQHFEECTKSPSHGNFILHGSSPLPVLINLGHRDLLLPADYVTKHYRLAFPAAAVHADFDGVLKQIQQACTVAPRILLDIDCDVFDPAYFPAVTHPTPFGLSPSQVLRVLDAVWSDRVVGVSLSEFDPGRDHNDQSFATLIWLVEYVLLRRHEK